MGIRNAIYDRFSIRWSELLRLPYWDPTRFTVLDSMHNLFLGDLAHHIRRILGIDPDAQPPGEEYVRPHNPEEQQEQLDGVIDALKRGSRTGLMRFRKGYITSLALANNVAPHVNLDFNSAGSVERARIPKSSYIDALLEWVSAFRICDTLFLKYCQRKTHPQAEIRCPAVLPHPTADFSTIPAKISNPIILHKGVLREVWSDMANTTIPSWLKRAPANFGSASHGKIKADQWRTVCLVNLVITLGRLWGTSSAGEKNNAILRNYFSLVITVRWATTRSTSETHAKLVDDYYAYYLKTTIELFGENALRTNNNHATQHLSECLRSFGPVHGWWAFPFERFNGIIQRTRTNRQLGWC